MPGTSRTRGLNECNWLMSHAFTEQTFTNCLTPPWDPRPFAREASVGLCSQGSQSGERNEGNTDLPISLELELKLVSSLSFSGLTEHLLCPESQDAGLDMQT